MDSIQATEEMINYFNKKYSNVANNSSISTVNLILTIAIYSRNHQEFILKRKAKQTLDDESVKYLVDEMVGAKLNTEIRDRIFSVLDYIFGKTFKFIKQFRPEEEDDFHTVFTVDAAITNIMYILFLPIFQKHPSLLLYVNRVLNVKEDYYKQVLELCNNELISSNKKQVCASNGKMVNIVSRDTRAGFIELLKLSFNMFNPNPGLTRWKRRESLL